MPSWFGGGEALPEGTVVVDDSRPSINFFRQRPGSRSASSSSCRCTSGSGSDHAGVQDADPRRLGDVSPGATCTESERRAFEDRLPSRWASGRRGCPTPCWYVPLGRGDLVPICRRRPTGGSDSKDSTTSSGRCRDRRRNHLDWILDIFGKGSSALAFYLGRSRPRGSDARSVSMLRLTARRADPRLFRVRSVHRGSRVSRSVPFEVLACRRGGGQLRHRRTGPGRYPD